MIFRMMLFGECIEWIYKRNDFDGKFSNVL